MVTHAEYPLDWVPYPVVPMRLRLLGAEFVDFEDYSDEECAQFASAPQLLQSLALLRPTFRRLSAALEIKTPEDAPVHLNVRYAVDYEVVDQLPTEDVERTLRHAAFYLAPRTVFPYLREFISSLTVRWRGGEIILPYFPLPVESRQVQEMTIPEPLSFSESDDQAEFTLEYGDEKTGTDG